MATRVDPLRDRANRLAAALDPAALMERLGLVPDPWQAQVLRSQARRILLLCARQTGKSLVAACAALYEALFHPPALVLLLSPTLRQSQELFKKVTAFYQGPGSPVAPEQESALRMELANGSRIVSLPGKEETIRGYSGARLLVIDEAARVDDELYLAVRPMLAVSGGRLLCLSTPYGKRGFFYEAWESGGATWERVKIDATQCPRISPEFLEEEQRAMPDAYFRQEYFNEWMAAEDSAFSRDDVMRAISDEIKPLFGVPQEESIMPSIASDEIPALFAEHEAPVETAPGYEGPRPVGRRGAPFVEGARYHCSYCPWEGTSKGALHTISGLFCASCGHALVRIAS